MHNSIFRGCTGTTSHRVVIVSFAVLLCTNFRSRVSLPPSPQSEKAMNLACLTGLLGRGCGTDSYTCVPSPLCEGCVTCYTSLLCRGCVELHFIYFPTPLLSLSREVTVAQFCFDRKVSRVRVSATVSFREVVTSRSPKNIACTCTSPLCGGCIRHQFALQRVYRTPVCFTEGVPHSPICFAEGVPHTPVCFAEGVTRF